MGFVMHRNTKRDLEMYPKSLQKIKICVSVSDTLQICVLQ